MSDVAASGGYFISATGRPDSRLSKHDHGLHRRHLREANLHGLYDKLGVTKDLLTRGKFAGH